jgi:hypothetical protein
MSGKYTAEMHEEYRREQDEQAAREQRERQEQGAKGAARIEFLRAGGTEEAFEAAWPGIRQEQLKKRSVDTDAAGRAAQSGMGISSL